MKVFHLFLFILIYIGCTRQIEDNVDLLSKELAVTPVLSSSFDSLLQDIKKLPPKQQVAITLQISNREEEIDGLLKQEKLLLEALPLASKKEKKKLLLRLLELYEKLDNQKYLDANLKGIQLSEELETHYSLTQEEDWKIKKIKAALLNRRGLHEQYLPIWFELLAAHRAANIPTLIIEDLCTIANYFAILGDQEKSVSLYKEAYKLAIDNHLLDLSNQCLTRLIYLFYDLKLYTEVVNYSNKTGTDSVSFMPSIYSMLSMSYLKLQKPDSARFYLTKMDQMQIKGYGMILNCRMADTYIAENRVDSALVFLQKAKQLFQYQAEKLKKKNIKVSLPFCFLSTYSSLATLYQQNEIGLRVSFRTYEALLYDPMGLLWRLINSYSF